MTPYDRIAERYAAHHTPLLHQRAYDRARFDVVSGARADGLPLLDAGCGPGHVARYLARSGCEVLGLDQSEAMIEIVRREGGVEAVRGDLDALPFEAASFGGAIASHSLIHVEREALPRYLDELARVLAPGAPLLLVLFQGDGVRQYEPVPGQAPLEVTCYQRKEVEAVLSRAPFERIRAEGRRPYPFEGPEFHVFATARRASLHTDDVHEAAAR